VSTQGILYVCQSGAKVVDLPLSSKQTSTQVQRDTCAVRHRSSEDLWVHSRGLESILLPPMVECVDRVLQVMVPGVVPARQHLPSSVSHCLSTGRTWGGTGMLADHLLSVEDLHDAGELHAPWHGNTLNLVLRGLGDAQLKQLPTKLVLRGLGDAQLKQLPTKLCGNSR
jgi:hypothetical protein